MKNLWQSAKAFLNKERFRIVLLFIFALGLLLRLNNLSGRSLWTDEFFTLFQSSGHGVDVVKFIDDLSEKKAPPLLKPRDFRFFLQNEPARNIKDVTEGLLYTDTHPPLYFWIIYFWMRLFGDALFALRFFSVLMGFFAIFLAYRIGIRLFNQQAAVFCALFTAVTAFSVRYSQEARSYSLIMATGLLSSLFLLRLEKNNKNQDAFWFSVFTALGLYIHYFYAFLAIGHFIYFNVAHMRESAKIRRFYLAVLGSLLLFSPWLMLVVMKGYNFRNTEWIFGYPGIINKIGSIFTGISRYILIFDNPGSLPRISLLTGIASFIYLAIYGVSEIVVKYRRQFWFCLSIFVVPLSAMLFLDIVQHGALLRQERFWIFSFLGFIPLAGYSLSLGFSRNKKVTSLLILLMLVSSFLVSKVQFGPAPKSICRWINKEAKGRASAVVACNMRGVLFAQSYYLDNDIYLLPVSDSRQLTDTVKIASILFDQVFIVRHYHRTDSSLINELFMETADIGGDFRPEETVSMDDISSRRFIKHAL
ncbi:MAG: glycosyltransferase family 39 protein [Candidatus Omnitrophica bacterium]|nr:glycosyltransferase family 39 protein [Candidatus Omnitrophota bacterium]